MAGGGQHDDDANADTYADDVDADAGDRGSEAGNILYCSPGTFPDQS